MIEVLRKVTRRFATPESSEHAKDIPGFTTIEMREEMRKAELRKDWKTRNRISMTIAVRKYFGQLLEIAVNLGKLPPKGIRGEDATQYYIQLFENAVSGMDTETQAIEPRVFKLLNLD